MNDVLPTFRIGSPSRALHFSYEKAGLTVSDQPIPWNAEAVVVEATLRLPSASLRRTADFTLRVAGGDQPIPCDAVRKLDATDPQEDHRYSVTFRLPPLAVDRTVEVLWRTRSLGQLELPVVGREAFLENLRLQMPTIFVRLGDETIACQTFVATQCRGLTASGVLTSPGSLAPLADVDLEVEFRNEQSEAVQRVAARLHSGQLAARQALLSVASPQHPRQIGMWTVTWFAAARTCAAADSRHFTASVSSIVACFRYAFCAPGGGRLGAGDATAARSGTARPARSLFPCEQPRAGHGRALHVACHGSGARAAHSPVLFDEETLITDGLSVIAPGTLNPADREEVTAFALNLGNRSLCVLPLVAAPAADFNSEGGFRPPPAYTWSPAADEELNDRLGRLLEEKFKVQ